MGKRNVLGKGLGALIPGATDEELETSLSSGRSAAPPGQQVIELKITDIEPNPHQPRTQFDPKAISELAQSIREKGIIQPLTVRVLGTGYQLIAGERRYRAALQTELEKVPALVLDVGTDQEMMELSLIENIQREDLNPVEEAKAYRMLMEQCFLTQEEVAQKVGKDRSTVANILRLLQLPQEILESLEASEISMGHARALLGLNDDRIQIELCKNIISQGLSVRRIESLVKTYRDGKTEKPRFPVPKDPHILSLQEDLQRRFGTGVNITRRGKTGKIEIEFYSDDDLDRLLDLLNTAQL